MSTSCRSSSLLLAASCEALSPQLANLLALQRAEEPETTVLLVEAQQEDIFLGLMSGHYDLGIAWAAPTELPLSMQSLWQDELAVAMPSRSPLLAHSTISPKQLALQPLLYWCPPGCAVLNPSTNDFQQSLHPIGLTAMTSFALMAVLVAAGYGIGIAPQSRIVQARHQGIVMRRLAGAPHEIGMGLFRRRDSTGLAADRFARRAHRVAASDLHPAPSTHALRDTPPGLQGASSQTSPPR